MSCTCSDTATIDFVLGDTTNNQWKIKVDILLCDVTSVVRNTSGIVNPPPPVRVKAFWRGWITTIMYELN